MARRAARFPRRPRVGAGSAWAGRYAKTCCALLLICLVLPAAAPAADDPQLTALKAAFVYRFTSFIDWPEAPASEPFVVGVIADPAMATELRRLESSGHRAEGRPIRVHERAVADDLGDCDILFIGGAAGDQLASIVRRTAGKPILLVGDTSGFAGRGVAIELFRQPDILGKRERLRFRIAPSALRGRGLTVSARLYDVAEVQQ